MGWGAALKKNEGVEEDGLQPLRAHPPFLARPTTGTNNNWRPEKITPTAQ